MKKNLVITVLLSGSMFGILPAFADRYAEECIKPDNFPHQIGDVGCLGDGLIPVYNDIKMGYADIKGRLVVPYQYETTHNFYDGRGLVSKLKTGGIIDNTKDYLVGYVDNQGKVVIPLIYDFDLSGNFMQGLGVAWVGKNGKIGLIDKAGKVVIPFQYQYAYDFMSNGLAWVQKNKKWGLVDKTGKVVVAFQYDDYRNGTLPENRHLVAKKGKYGYVDDFGKAVTELKYDTPFDENDFRQYWFYDGISELTINGKPSCVNIQGKTVKCP